MSEIPYNGGIATNLGTVSAGDVSNQLALHANGRSLMYLQWALWNAVHTSYPNLKVTGVWSADTQAALDEVRNGQYSIAKYGPFDVPSVNKTFLTDLFADYASFPAPLSVIA